jgi:ribosomal-protein-serine acetyltransferase
MFYADIGNQATLRILEEQHAAQLFALVDANRSHLRAWLPWLDNNTSVEASRSFIRHSLQQFANNDGFQAGIWQGDAMAGVIGYHTLDWANRKTDIGYWLGVAFQGHGLMTRATRTLVNHAFGELGLNRVEIRCAVGNSRSCAIPQRLGFRQEGVLRQIEWLYDHFVDHVVYGMLASEWPCE